MDLDTIARNHYELVQQYVKTGDRTLLYAITLLRQMMAHTN